MDRLKDFALRLKRLRQAKKITQIEIAQIIGISIPTYSAYERAVRYPDVTMLFTLADCLETTAAFLLTGDTKSHIDVATLTNAITYVTGMTSEAETEVSDRMKAELIALKYFELSTTKEIKRQYTS